MTDKPSASESAAPSGAHAPIPELARKDRRLYQRIAEKMYEKMPVPQGVIRVPFARLDQNATSLWLLLAKAAVDALNEMDL